MMHIKLWINITIVLLLLGLGACAALNNGQDLPLRHETVEDLGQSTKNCLDCHDARSEKLAFASFVHTPNWTQAHRQQASQNEATCSMCHQPSFCIECHGVGMELKPSIKSQNDTYRQMPHRGDYLSRHRIDGRVDPTSCFRCHGNPKSARTCAPCHG
jgi:hypothetical protein